MKSIFVLASLLVLSQALPQSVRFEGDQTKIPIKAEIDVGFCIFLSWVFLKRYGLLYKCKILKNVGSKSKLCRSKLRTFVTHLCYIVFRIVMYQTQSLKYARDKLAV